MNFEVIIPTRGELLKMENILKSINGQTLLPERVIFIIDNEVTQNQFQEITYFLTKGLIEGLQNNLLFITHLNSDFVPFNGVSYVRNYGIDISKSDCLFFIDDDNVFQSNFFEKIVNQRITNKLRYKKDLLIAPLMLFRKTNIVQSQGFNFNFWLSKVNINKNGNSLYFTPSMLSGNSIFGGRSIFDKYRFDEEFKFVYEDLDFSYRAYLGGVPLLVLKSVAINHMEVEKSKLRKLYIQDSMSAYQKSKNRILFVKKNGSKYDKYKFFTFGLWIQTFWFIFLILLYGKEKYELIQSIYYGTKDGLKYR